MFSGRTREIWDGSSTCVRPKVVISRYSRLQGDAEVQRRSEGAAVAIVDLEKAHDRELREEVWRSRGVSYTL